MTLGRQLVSTISALFLVALIGVEAIHLRSAHDSLQQQLEALAQDTATSLGVSLGILLRGGPDQSLAETLINPVFDRGHYGQIEFVSSGGETLVRKVLGAHDEGDYPAWFADLFPLGAPTAESFVSGGWRQLGKVRVSVHPRFAYIQLWQTAQATLIYLLLIYAAGLLALRLILIGVLRPLVAIESAAGAISARNFVTIDARPRTRELARVVEAMNALSRKIGDAIATETARADALQRAAYVDEVTGLLNRQGLSAQFDNAYGDEQERFSGAFALLEIAELGAINRELGPARCDELLAAAGSAMAQVSTEARGLSARWAGAQLALTLPGLGSAAAVQALAALQSRLSFIIGEYGPQDRTTVVVGAVAGDLENASLEAIVQTAQEALADAQQSERSMVVRQFERGASMMVTMDAAKLVNDALASRSVLLVGQPVMSLPGGTLLHTELMARIPEGQGRVMPAGRFMAIVAQQRLARQLDEAVLARVQEEARRLGGAQEIAINLSASSLDHPAFLEWLVGWVKSQPAGFRVSFELTEHGVVHNEPAAAAFATAITKAGAGFGIDHFGVHRNSLALVPVLKPAYVKLSSLHTPRLAGDAGTRFFVDSVVRAARQLDVPVIAQNVESEAQLAELQKLGIAGYQGYLTGAPSPWPRA